jgi:hypothetical protein
MSYQERRVDKEAEILMELEKICNMTDETVEDDFYCDVYSKEEGEVRRYLDLPIIIRVTEEAHLYISINVGRSRTHWIIWRT